MPKNQSKKVDIPGWFPWVDQQIFKWILGDQTKEEVTGDLLEVGAYMGKSAVLIGDGLNNKEVFTVIDLFDEEAPDEANLHEMRTSYATLTRKRFEENYLQFHKKLPKIIQGTSEVALKKVRSNSCRFIHIDGSHLYEHVVADISSAKKILKKNGIIVCDDYRSAHTPGVAAAVWQAVLTDGLKPICITPAKFYGTWGDPAPVQQKMRKWVEGVEQLRYSIEHVAENEIVRIQYTTNPDKKLHTQIERLNKLLNDRNKEIEAIRKSGVFRVAYTMGKPLRLARRIRSKR